MGRIGERWLRMQAAVSETAEGAALSDPNWWDEP